MGGRDGGFFEHAGIALDEEDVEQEIQRQRTEVYEGRDQAPVLEGSR